MSESGFKELREGFLMLYRAADLAAEWSKVCDKVILVSYNNLRK